MIYSVCSAISLARINLVDYVLSFQSVVHRFGNVVYHYTYPYRIFAIRQYLANKVGYSLLYYIGQCVCVCVCVPV